MIYLFHGSDSEKVRAKAFAWVAAARAKEPNLAYARLAQEELSAAALGDAAASGGLFVKRLLVLLDDPFAKEKEIEDEDVGRATSHVEDALEMLAASDNAIIILAPKLPATKAKKIVGMAKAEYKYDKPAAAAGGRGFNSALVNALANRSRAALWLELERALRAGDAPEMVHGVLHWKARDLMEKGSAKWSRAEARRLSLDLIELLQSTRRGGLLLPLALEKFALSM